MNPDYGLDFRIKPLETPTVLPPLEAVHTRSSILGEPPAGSSSFLPTLLGRGATPLLSTHAEKLGLVGCWRRSTSHLCSLPDYGLDFQVKPLERRLHCSKGYTPDPPSWASPAPPPPLAPPVQCSGCQVNQEGGSCLPKGRFGGVRGEGGGGLRVGVLSLGFRV